MKLSKTELSQLYDQYTTEHPPEDCPTAEVLTRAAMNELNATERARIAEHLGSCPNCGEEYRLILSLQPWAAQAAERLQAASGETPALPKVSTPPRKESSGWADWIRSMFAWPALPVTVAALLLLVTSFLAYKLISVRRENAELMARTRTYEEQLKGTESSINSANEELQRMRQQADEANRKTQFAEEQLARLRQETEENKLRRNEDTQPQLNVHIADLTPRDSTRSKSEGTPQRIQIPATSNVVTLILNVTGQPNFADYSLEILDRQGKAIYQGRGLKRSAENNFTVALPRPSLPAGQYLFKLYGIRNGQSKLVQDYDVQLSYQ